uniref:Uncharacterized protein n=1 Tax=Chromera velia CCMP2878 TaxID=1169474 RepID=A0A0G4G3I0_9ALVE|eukprot:Cvel_4131.t1-p1 / transcript=Cvel_4131.t1 / gene=Cvel_4131 / organism=Chromera_velia_CCMP2878 / gene_product=Zinc finger protein 571, putative / transcript_product=Zinc finger protein 571, putative / location=Cvel_scaffold177:4022-4561(-) / protein_length=180 / sequence_SO=supercontig / SO=protein_coding / is_pseudo=false
MGGSGICAKIAVGVEFVCMAANGTTARTAEEKRSVSTDAADTDVKIVEEREFAYMNANGTTARNAEGRGCVSMDASGDIAGNAVGKKSVSTAGRKAFVKPVGEKRYARMDASSTGVLSAMEVSFANTAVFEVDAATAGEVRSANIVGSAGAVQNAKKITLLLQSARKSYGRNIEKITLSG